MLTKEEIKRRTDFIVRNYQYMTMRAMARALGINVRLVHGIMKKNGLQRFRCKPPHSCFECPYETCERDGKITNAEDEWRYGNDKEFKRKDFS